MLDSLVNRPNHVPERQRLVQASTAPIYYRLPRGRLYVKSYYTAFGVAMIGTVYGVYNLIKGKPATE